MSRVLEEHDYIGFSEVEQTSDKPKSTVNLRKNPRKHLTLKATELRLGLPGSEFPDIRVFENGENGVDLSLGVVKNLVSGAKRGFSDGVNGGSSNWVLCKNGGSEMGCLKNAVSLSSVLGVGDDDDEKLQNSSPVSGQSIPAQAPSKAQVVGWPPIRSYRKNSMAVNTLKDNENKNYELEPGCFYIKVSMDGAPYLRKIDLKTYGSYVGLSSALEKMFGGFTIGQLGNQGLPGHDESRKGRLADDLQLSEYVLTYEDKDGDWMLVGDVPWNMFMDSCRRLRIIKFSNAVGLGSRVATEN